MPAFDSPRRIWRNAFLPLVDFAALMLGASVVYLVRYRWFDISFTGSTGQDLDFGLYILFSILLSLICVFIYALQGVYSLSIAKTWWQIAVNLAIGIFLILFAIIVFLFFNEYNRSAFPQGVPVSRFILATGGFFALYFVLTARFLFTVVEQVFYKLNIGTIKLIYIGDENDRIFSWIDKRKDVVKIYHFGSLSEDNFEEIKKLLLTDKLIKELYLISYETQSDLGGRLAREAEINGVGFTFYPKVFQKYTSFGLKAVNLSNQVYLKLVHSNLDGWWIVIKRIFDFLFAWMIVILLSPLFLIIGILIKLDSRGPVFYPSERVGPDGRIFKLWKFRRFKQEYCVFEDDPKSREAIEFEKKLIKEKNMRPGDILYKIKDDPRQTRFGKILEITSLDELPQFFNVVLGNMSVVGPRPHQPREVAQYSNIHYKVLNIKPGITGLAQINGRNELSIDEEVSMDTYYLENWSIFLDLWIIIKTPFVVLLRILSRK